jgi:23S rRNA pseudouridine1911/1915/1917 synthase
VTTAATGGAAHRDDIDDPEDGDEELLPLPSSSGPSAPLGPLTFTAPFGGARLDAVLAGADVLAGLGLSRSRLKSLVEDGHVVVGGVVVTRAATKLRGGEKVTVTVPAPAPVELIPEDLPLALLYDDDDLCVVDKPAGLVVHPGAGHARGTVANALLHRFPGLSISGERRPGIVHRLDKDTSGLLVVAKNDATLQALQAQFVARTVEKRYLACCLGAPGDVGAVVDIQTGHRRAENDRRRFTTKVPPSPSSSVRLAHTVLVTRALRDGVAVVDVTLHTGRTHQIRAHLADRGHPLLQDALYGGGHAERRLPTGPVRDAVARLTRQALHAASLAFTQPRTGQRLTLSSALPPDLQAVVAAVAG